MISRAANVFGYLNKKQQGVRRCGHLETNYCCPLPLPRHPNRSSLSERGPDLQGIPSRRTQQYPVFDYAFIEASNPGIGGSVVFDSEARKEFSEYVRQYRIKSHFWFGLVLPSS